MDSVGGVIRVRLASQLLKRNPHPGRLIALDGRDGAGKTTLAHELSRHLTDRGVDSLIVKLPSELFHGSPLARAWKGTSSRLRFRCVEQLSGLDRVFVFDEVVIPKLAAGTWVILDRFLTSSLGKAAAGRVNATDVTVTARHLLMPDHWLWLHCSPSLARTRIKATRPDDPDAQVLESAYRGDLELGERVCRLHGIEMIDTSVATATELAEQVLANASRGRPGREATTFVVGSHTE